jgi:hypothetical protein
MDFMDTTGASKHMPSVDIASSGSYWMRRWMSLSWSTGSSKRCTALYVKELMACVIAVSRSSQMAMLMKVYRSTVSATILHW